MSEMIDAITFNTTVAPFFKDETAGFPSDLAAQYVKAGVAAYARRNIPRVDPKVAASDAMRQLDEIAGRLATSAREAKDNKRDPGAAEALRIANEGLRKIEEMREQLSTGQLTLPAEQRLPAASQGAA